MEQGYSQGVSVSTPRPCMSTEFAILILVFGHGFDRREQGHSPHSPLSTTVWLVFHVKQYNPSYSSRVIAWPPLILYAFSGKGNSIEWQSLRLTTIH